MKIVHLFILGAVVLSPIAEATPQTSPKSAPKPAATLSPASSPSPTPTHELGSLFNRKEMNKEPTFINSKTLTVNHNTKIFEYTGDVVVTQGDMKLTSKSLTGVYSEKNDIETLTAKGDVVITKGEDMKARGNRAFYRAADQTVLLTESPEIEQKGNLLSADEIKVFLDENRSVASGQVRVKVLNRDSNVSIPKH
jgi:lipopolysaccharide export system protein LptA